MKASGWSFIDRIIYKRQEMELKNIRKFKKLEIFKNLKWGRQASLKWNRSDCIFLQFENSLNIWCKCLAPNNKPYCKKERRKSLIRNRQSKTSNGSRFIILKKIPHVLDNFFESSLRWYFQLRCSSKRGPKNLKKLDTFNKFFPYFNSSISRKVKDYVVSFFNI